MPTYKQSEPKPVYFVEPGTYKVEIVNAMEKLSKAGNPMIKLICRVEIGEGAKGPEVHEHLTFTEKAGWKIDQVREACGFAVVPGEDIDVQPEHFIGKTAMVVLGEEEGADPGHRFNTLERWVSPKASAPAPKAKPAKETDDIPF
jgi:hypothetical protein